MFNERLKKLRENFVMANGDKMTQDDLAKALGFSGKSTVSQWEAGVRSPDPTTIVKIAKLFNCTTDYLLGLSNNCQVTSEISEEERKKAEIKKALNTLVAHDDGEFPIENDLINTIYDAMIKGRKFHTKRKKEDDKKEQ